jgi:hypothetical protein
VAIGKGNTFLVDNILQKIDEKRLNQKALLEKYTKSIDDFRRNLEFANTPQDLDIILENLIITKSKDSCSRMAKLQKLIK